MIELTQIEIMEVCSPQDMHLPLTEEANAEAMESPMFPEENRKENVKGKYI